MVTTRPQEQTPLHDDLVAMLLATRAAERDLYERLDPATRDAPRRIGDWSARDVLAHLAAWRSIEALRLGAAGGSGPTIDVSASGPEESEDEENARIQAERAEWSWDRVDAEAQASIDALVAAIRSTPADALRESDGLVAGIGGNGANHAIAHLADIATMAHADDRFRAFAAEVEAILDRGALEDRDSAVMLYNIACHSALSGELADARRLLADALHRRPDLLDWAVDDPDVAVLRDELPGLAGH